MALSADSGRADQHAGLAMARLVTKTARPEVEYDQACLKVLLGEASTTGRLLCSEPRICRPSIESDVEP